MSRIGKTITEPARLRRSGGDDDTHPAAGLTWQIHGTAAVREILGLGKADAAAAIAKVIDGTVIWRIVMLDNGLGEPGNTLELSSLIEDFNGTWDANWDSAAEDAAFIDAALSLPSRSQFLVWCPNGGASLHLASAGRINACPEVDAPSRRYLSWLPVQQAGYCRRIASGVWTPAIVATAVVVILSGILDIVSIVPH